MEQSSYFELIMDLIELYNQGKVGKGVIDCIPEDDIQAARKWAYQKQKNRDNQNEDEWPVI